MSSVVLISIIAIALFAAAFFSKRRFGILALSLSAGFVLSDIWNYDAGLILSSTGLVPEGKMTAGITILLLTLLPSIILMFAGKKYKTVPVRIASSMLFAILALVFLTDSFKYLIDLRADHQVYDILVSYRGSVIGAGMIIAVVDIFATKSPHKLDKKSKH